MNKELNGDEANQERRKADLLGQTLPMPIFAN
jgi:hypothetical protein